MQLQPIQEIKIYMKENNITYQQLSEKSKIPLNTLKNIFRGKTANPRMDTMNSIYDALGLKDELTPEEIEAGMGHHAVVLSDDDSYRLDVLARAEETLGKPYVDGVMALIEFNITEAKKSKKAKIST